MDHALETTLNVLVSLTLLALLLGPEIVGHLRELRIDRQLRAAERGEFEDPESLDERIGVHLTPLRKAPGQDGNGTCTAA